MTSDQVYTRLSSIFRNLFDDETVVLTPETTAADIAGWDSMAHINLLLTIQSEFGVSFKAADIEQMHSVKDLVDFIMQKQAKE